MSDSEIRKNRGIGYGWQTDKEYERSRGISDAARPGCWKIIFWMMIVGLVGSIFTGDIFDLFSELDSWQDYVGIFIVFPLVLRWMYKNSKH